MECGLRGLLVTLEPLRVWKWNYGLLGMVSLCFSLNIVALEIEVDAKVILDWVLNEHNCNLNHTTLIMDCRAFINQVLQVKMMYCFRRTNKCADALALRGPIT